MATFDPLIERVKREVAIVTQVVRLHEALRDLLFSAPSTPDPFSGVRALLPAKPSWQIYDHCASFTRIYAVFGQFIEDITNDYLALLPAVYSSYVDLPDSLRKQHRIGLGQILLKIGDDGPYRHLKENEIIADLAQGLAGAAKFKLVPDAFFIDRQNFRLDVLAKLFTNLGIDDSVRKLKAHPGLKKFMDEHGEDFDLSNYLAEFVSERNDVGHSQVENTVSVDQVSEVGEFIIIFCEAIAWLLETEISTIRIKAGNGTLIANVTETHHGNYVVVAEFCTDAALQVGQTLYLKSKSGITRAEILSLQINGIEHSKLQAKSKQEVGMRLSSRGFLRAEVYALDPTTPLRESKQKEIQFADEVGIAVGIAEAADADSELEAALQGVDLELTDIDPTELEAALADPTLGSPLSNLSPARANLSSPASSASITTETQGNDAPKPDDLEKD